MTIDPTEWTLDYSGLTNSRAPSRNLTSYEKNATADVTSEFVADSTVECVFVISLRVLRIIKPSDFKCMDYAHPA